MKKILALMPRSPLGLDTGGKLRNYHLCKGLSRHFTMDVLFFSEESEAGQAEAEQLREFCSEAYPFPFPPQYTIGKKIAGLLGRHPLPILNYHSPGVLSLLESHIGRAGYDALVAESIHMVPYGLCTPAPIIRVWDWHNIESRLMSRYASTAPSTARRVYARLTARKLAAAERRLAPQYPVHLTCSAEEAAYVQDVAPGRRVEVVPNGVDDELLKVEISPSKCEEMIFVGSMDYVANIDAVEYFVLEILPRVRAAVPEAHLSIVGRDPDPRVRRLAEQAGVAVTGAVPSVMPYYRRARLSLCPFRVAGGTRLKIFESMALGVPVVSTSLGAEGIPYSQEENIHIAEDPDAFARGVTRLMHDDEYHRRLTGNARRFAAEKYGWSGIADRLAATLEEMIGVSS